MTKPIDQCKQEAKKAEKIALPNFGRQKGRIGSVWRYCCSGSARACALAHNVLTALSKREEASSGTKKLLVKFARFLWSIREIREAFRQKEPFILTHDHWKMPIIISSSFQKAK